MPELVAALFYAKREAQEQGGLLSGNDPSQVNTNDPIRLWIIQVGVIVSTATLLSLVLKRIRQPKVIAEVLGGIILGPTALGRIPGFTEHIFPQDSRPFLSLVANIGLVLFLFLVGLEIDGGVIKRNAKLSVMVAGAGMVLPFGAGVGLAKALYDQFVDDSVEFTHFMLFVGVAFSITAFPVLCRILTELKLLDTTVGIVVLSAGVGNDIIGWVLLALSVALVNAGSGLTALYILLVCVAWTLILLFPGRWALAWLARKTGSIENGPTMFFMTVTILLVFGSAFFTDIIGVHAIFGAFVAGIIVPREGGLAIALTEKLEDMVSIIFLPLYFTLSGLSTDLGLLNTGLIWGYTVAICLLAFVGKFGGCTIAARYAAGFNWRESCAIGSLMSCKGLVELIVLNVGLQAGILSPRIFSMFVLEALLLTFITTPLVTVFYPPDKRVRVSATGANFNNVADNERPTFDSKRSAESVDHLTKSRFTIVLDKLEHVPGMMAMAQLLQPASNPVSELGSSKQKRHLRSSVEALRLIELSDRVSGAMKAGQVDVMLHTDPLLSIFRMFGELNDISISSSVSIVPYEDLAYSAAEHARLNGSDMVILPWLPPTYTSAEDTFHETPVQTPRSTHHHNNPFDALFRASNMEKSASAIHSHFLRGVFLKSVVDVAVFVDQGSRPQAGASHHLFVPFFGGPDDRLALNFAAQLCEHTQISATILKVSRAEAPISPVSSAHLTSEKGKDDAIITQTIASAANFPDTVYGQHNTETRLQSDTADNIIWSRYTSDNPTLSSPNALSRMTFESVSSPLPLHTIIQKANDLVESSDNRRVLVIVGRSRRLAVESHDAELRNMLNVDHPGKIGSEVKKTIGDVASAFSAAGCGAGIVVLQAAI